jgi:hypothetical protein
MAGLRKFTRIPPESTGDRIRVKSHTNIFYNSKVSDIIVGSTITLLQSGLSGTVSYLREDTVSTGMIAINWNELSENNETTVPVAGEAIQIDNGTVASVAASVANTDPYDTFANVNTLVSYDNHYYGQKVSEQGEAYVRFGEGPARVDAAGKLEIGQWTILAQYSFTYDIAPDEFGVITTGGGSIVHSSPENCALLSVTTAPTDKVTFRTHLFHHYTPGIPIIYEGTTTHSDAGKANQVRRWGLFDDQNGLFFELDGTDLNFVRRTFSTGTAVETKIPQSTWNRDTLDGSQNGTSNPSGESLDITNINSYWIDYTWHGAGIVRFGVFLDGKRILCHVQSFANKEVFSYMSRGSLPVNWEIENTGNTASTSEMRSWSCGVYASASFNIIDEGKTYTYFTPGPLAIPGTTETKFASVRPKDQISGIDNHNVVSFVKLNFMAYDNSANGTTSLAKVRLYLGGTLTGDTWNSGNPGSSLEVDTSGTYSNDGIQIAEYYVQGVEEIDLRTVTGYWYRSIQKQVDGSSPTYHFTVQKVSGVNNMNFDAQFRWKEIRG